MTRFPIPDEALSQHTAVLGKTGSGKTSTAKTIVEHLVSQGARVCVLDPIKSDWWGLTSSADGKKAGLPFHILGGPRGHVPLHSSSGKAIAEIVANGNLPLSILDMADFAPGGQAKFFIDFAPALLRRMRGVVHLVMEEAHLFAPKERSGLGDENMAIHWAKMLATAGRSKGIRLILATQRTQALHNAMLGSCETMVAHRLTAPADQKPLIDWLKANTEKDVVEKVSGSLASLKTGTAWVCSGETKFFEMIHFPRIKTYDNSATPAAGDMGRDEVRTAPVDVDKLRAIVGDAAKEAEANDPRLLKAEVAKLRAELAKAANAKPSERLTVHDYRAQEKAISAAVAQAFSEGAQAVRETIPAMLDAQHKASFQSGFEFLAARRATFEADFIPARKALPAVAAALKTPSKGPSSPTKPSAAVPPRAPCSSRGPADGLPAPQRKVLASIGFWHSVGQEAPSRAQVGGVAGYSPSSGGFNNLLGQLNTAGLITIPMPGTVALAPGAPYEALSPEEAQAKVYSVLSNPERKLVDAVLAARGGPMSRDDLGAATDYSPSSGGFNNLIGGLCTLTIFEKPAPGQVSLSAWAREVLS